MRIKKPQHSLDMTYFWRSSLQRLLWKATTFFALLFKSTSFAFAGYAGGPYVVWVNLDHSPDKRRIDGVIADYATSKAVNCDGQWKMGDSLLYMKKRPPLIDNDLVEGVFLRKNSAQKKRLNFALRNYRDIDFHHHDGLDGIIAYTTQGDAKMMSLTTGKNKIESVTIASHGNRPAKEDIEDAFCALLPPITRAP